MRLLEGEAVATENATERLESGGDFATTVEVVLFDEMLVELVRERFAALHCEVEQQIRTEVAGASGCERISKVVQVHAGLIDEVLALTTDVETRTVLALLDRSATNFAVCEHSDVREAHEVGAGSGAKSRRNSGLVARRIRRNRSFVGTRFAHLLHELEVVTHVRLGERFDVGVRIVVNGNV